MDQNQKTVKLGFYLDILSRRRWYMIIPFCIAMSIGIYFAIVLPKFYIAKTVLFFQPPEVPEDFVQSIQTTQIESKIDHIYNEITSRDSLREIIRQFNLYMNQDQDELDINNNLIEDLRSYIKVELISEAISGDLTTDTFSISFTWTDPEKTMHVANALAALFIEKRLEDRKAKALDTTLFLEEEIQETRLQLEELEQKIKDFRLVHMGGLPEQLANNMKTIDRLETLHSAKQEHLLDAKNRLILLNNQLSENQAQLRDIYISSEDDADFEMNPILRLQKMKVELEDLYGRYTPQHPDIVRLKKMIKELEQQIESGDIELSEAVKHKFSMQEMEQLNPMLAERRRSLLGEIEATKLDIKTLKIESSQILDDIETHQKLVQETPLKEQELKSLERDYDNLQNNYNELLNRKVQAKLAASLEKKAKGEQFSILRRARLPKEPSEPNLKKLFFISIFFAVNFGVGMVILLEYFNPYIREIGDLESKLGIPVLASIPKIYSTYDKVKYRTNQVLTFASILLAFALIAGFVTFILKGVEPTIDMVQSLIEL